MVVDPFTDTLTALDADTLAPRARFEVCRGPEQVIATPDGSVFVSCRHDRRVLALDPSLSPAGSVDVGPEPFGLAASRRGGWLYVTTAGDSKLHRLSARTLGLSFSHKLPPGARGVGVSDDGNVAIVAHLHGRSASLVDLREGTVHKVRLPGKRDGGPGELLDSTDLSALPARQPGAAYAVAMSPGGTRAFVPYALRNPAVVGGVAMQEGVCGTSYGADTPLIASIGSIDLAKRWVQRPKLRDLPEDEWTYGDFMGMNHLSELGVVRAAVHDPRRSRLLVAGEGSGLVLSFDTSTADPTASPSTAWQLDGPARGIAIDPSGRHAFVHLAIDRQIAVLDLGAANAGEEDDQEPRLIALSVEREPDAVERGRRLFYWAKDARTSSVDGVGCSSCHLEGRSDGITWALGDKVLQTPILAGRVHTAGPYRWHGDSPNLGHAVAEAIQRLAGEGLPANDNRDLVAFLRSSEPDIALPGSERTATRRGQEVFEESGCASCHDPDRGFTDGALHDFRGGQYRTPSLVGVSRSAPYYHDGSARSLRAVIDAHEPDNPMAVGRALDRADRRALLDYLQAL